LHTKLKKGLSTRIDTSNWKKFRIGDLFDIETGKDFVYGETNGNEYPVIGHGIENNGIACRTQKLDDYKLYNHKQAISLGHIGNFVAYVQAEDFYLGTRTKALIFKEEHSTESLIFITAIINIQSYKFSYGRVGSDKIPDLTIKLPATKNNLPDWQFMENYIKSLHYKPPTTKNKPGNALPLNPSNWKKFKIKDLFNVELSKGDIKLDEVDKGIIPLVSSGETNNGIVGYIDEGGDGKAEMFPQNRITLDMFGNAFYQNKPFYAVSHGRVNILSPKFDLTQNIGLFISAIINQEQYKYSYGRAVYSSVAENMDIKLPTTKNNLPDWQFMEDYIKSLPYGDRL